MVLGVQVAVKGREEAGMGGGWVAERALVGEAGWAEAVGTAAGVVGRGWVVEMAMVAAVVAKGWAEVAAMAAGVVVKGWVVEMAMAAAWVMEALVLAVDCSHRES
ncbi:hypothetical protein ABPG77_006849 [Micractinium sp. CCAP 211/92]